MTDQTFAVQGLPHQIEFWGDVTPDRRLALVGPLGTGKTFSLCFKALHLASVNRGMDGALVTPTYAMAKLTHAREWPEIMARYGVTLEYKPSNPPRFVWPWGDVTWVISGEKPERMAGPNLAYVLYDEPGQMSREAWERGSLRARHPDAKLRQVALAGTPEGINWFADEFDAPKGNAVTIRSTGWHPDAAHYPEQIRSAYGYDDSLMAAYGRGEFVPLRQGRCFRFFERGKHVRPTPELDENLPIILGCDFNVDSMRWEVLQIGSDWIRFSDEIALGADGSTEQAAREFVSRYEDQRGMSVVVSGDAAGKARSTSGQADYDVLMEVLREAHFRRVKLDVPKANPRQKDRVDNMNYHLSGRGKTVTVSPKCSDLIRDFERVTWKQGSTEIDKKDQTLTHASDGGTMAVWQLARMQSVGRRSVVGVGRGTDDPIMSSRF